MKKQKLNLNELKVKSFVTNDEIFNKKTIVGGRAPETETGIVYCYCW